MIFLTVNTPQSCYIGCQKSCKGFSSYVTALLGILTQNLQQVWDPSTGLVSFYMSLEFGCPDIQIPSEQMISISYGNPVNPVTCICDGTSHKMYLIMN